VAASRQATEYLFHFQEPKRHTIQVDACPAVGGQTLREDKHTRSTKNEKSDDENTAKLLFHLHLLKSFILKIGSDASSSTRVFDEDPLQMEEVLCS
jgi:hypothetical protein